MIPGASVARAAEEAAAFGGQLDREAPLPVTQGNSAGPVTRRWSATDRESLRNSAMGRASMVAYVLAAIGGLVLVVACSNLANLSLARGAVRRQELAVRRALGATRGRLIRELLAESALIAAAGMAASVLILRVLFVFCTIDLPVANQQVLSLAPVLDEHVLLYAAGAVLAALLMFGVEPAMQLTRESIRGVLAHGAPSVVAGPRRYRMLIRLQVAAAFGLLLIASIAVDYSLRLAQDDSGVALDRIAIGTVVFFPRDEFSDAHKRQATEAVLSILRAMPGVDRADAATGMPFGLMVTPLTRMGSPEGSGESEVGFELGSTPGYLETIGVAIERGRPFDARDTAESLPVAILSAATARVLFGSTDAVGRTIVTRTLATPPIVITRQVIGIAADTDVQSRGSRTSELIHIPLAQTSAVAVTFAVRGADPDRAADAIRLAVARALPGIAAAGVGPGVAMLAPGLPIARLASTVTLVLGLTALGLSMVGLHGVLAHLLSTRTREMALRLALGADRRQVWWLSIREGLRPVAGGLAIGLLAGGLLRLLVVGGLGLRVPTFDIALLVIVPAIFVAVAMAACALPAWRASRVDPNVALRDA
jgi:predicted permease